MEKKDSKQDKDFWWLDDLQIIVAGLIIPIVLLLIGLFGQHLGVAPDRQEKAWDAGLLGLNISGVGVGTRLLVKNGGKAGSEKEKG